MTILKTIGLTILFVGVGVLLLVLQFVFAISTGGDTVSVSYRTDRSLEGAELARLDAALGKEFAVTCLT